MLRDVGVVIGVVIGWAFHSIILAAGIYLALMVALSYIHGSGVCAEVDYNGAPLVGHCYEENKQNPIRRER